MATKRSSVPQWTLGWSLLYRMEKLSSEFFKYSKLQYSASRFGCCRFCFFFLRLPFIFFFESYITVVINPRLYYDCLENSCDTLNQSKCKIKTKRFFLTRFSCLIFVFHSVFPRFRQFAYSILFWALIGSLWYFPSFWLAVVIVSIFWFYNAPTYICHLVFGREWFLNRSQYKFFLTLRLCY